MPQFSISSSGRRNWHVLAIPLLLLLLIGAAQPAPAAPSEPFLVKDINPDGAVCWSRRTTGLCILVRTAGCTSKPTMANTDLSCGKATAQLRAPSWSRTSIPERTVLTFAFAEMNGRLFFSADDGIQRV